MKKRLVKIIALGTCATMLALPVVGSKLNNPITLAWADEANITEMTPIITPVPINENKAKSGAVIATLSLPNEVSGVTYELEVDQSSPVKDALEKYHKLLAIDGENVIIKNGLSDGDFADSDFRERMKATNDYKGAVHIKEGESIFFNVVAKKGDQKSKYGKDYDDAYKTTITIGSYEYEAEDDEQEDKAYNVTELKYYIGDKELASLQDSDWISISKEDVAKINTTNGEASHTMASPIEVATTKTASQMRSSKVYLKATVDKEEIHFVGQPNLTLDISDNMSISSGVVKFAYVNLTNNDGTFYRPIDFRVYVNVNPVNSLTYENFTINAKDGVLKDGTRLVVEELNGDEYTRINEKIKGLVKDGEASKLFKVYLISQGKVYNPETPVEMVVKTPTGLEYKGMKIYRVEDTNEELTNKARHKREFMTDTNKFGYFALISKENLTDPVLIPEEFDIEKHEPVITPVEIEENNAIAGAVVANLSMPKEYSGKVSKYEFEIIGEEELLTNTHSLLQIEGNNVIVRKDLDTADINKAVKDKYLVLGTDGKLRLKGGINLPIQLFAYDEDSISSNIARNFEDDKVGNIKITESKKDAEDESKKTGETDLGKDDRKEDKKEEKDNKKKTELNVPTFNFEELKNKLDAFKGDRQVASETNKEEKAEVKTDEVKDGKTLPKTATGVETIFFVLGAAALAGIKATKKRKDS